MPNNRFLYQAVEKMLPLLDSRFRGNDRWGKRSDFRHSRESGNPASGTSWPLSTDCYGKIAVVFLLSVVLLAALVFLFSVLNMQVGEVEVGTIQPAYGTGGGNPTPLPTPLSIFQTDELDIYYQPYNDIDALQEGNDYYVYIQHVPDNPAY